MREAISLKLLASSILIASATRLSATGFRLPDQDAFATARGEAFAATADNPSAIYYNPAGIAQLQGHQVRGSLYSIYIESTYDSSTGTDGKNERRFHTVPNFFYTYGPEGLPLTAGIGLYSPYGLSLRWPQDTGFRTIGTESSLTYITLNPAIAFRLHPTLMIGGGLTVNYANVDLSQGLFWPSQSLDRFRYRGDGWDVGYNLGLLWKPVEKLSFGVSFRSPTTVALSGHTDAYNDATFFAIPPFKHRSEAETRFPFPLNAIFGVSYRPTPNWNLEFNADYTDWTRMQTLLVSQSSSLPPLLPNDIPIQLEWQASWYYEFGVTRYFQNGWSVSAGYIYNENSIPNAHYTPLVTDLDRHFLSVGTGYKGKHLSVDVAYQFGYGPSHSVSGSAPSATGQTADGEYDFLSHAIMATAGWRF